MRRGRRHEGGRHRPGGERGEPPPPPAGERKPHAPQQKGHEPPRSWFWVEADEPAGKRFYLREASLAIEFAEGGGAVLDLFAERGGGGPFVGLTIQALRVPGVRRIEDLSGKVAVHPPPEPLFGIGKLAGPLRRPGAGVPLVLEEACDPEDLDMEEEEAAPDDDPSLGDIESYRRRRAEEGKSEPVELEPALDEAAIADAEAAAAAERALIVPGEGYEVTTIALRFGARHGEAIEIEVEGRAAAIDERGEVAREGVPFGGKIHARIEIAYG